MKMKTIVAMVMIGCSTSSGYSDAISDYAVGRQGANLKSTLATHFRPLASIRSESELFHALYGMQIDVDGLIPDFFTGDKVIAYYEYYDDNNNVRTSRIVEPQWMVYPVEYQMEAYYDLYNMILVEFTSITVKDVLPFGEVEDVRQESGALLRGYSKMGSELIECIEPTSEYKGDIARMLFYVVTIYPMELWGDWGAIVCRNNHYPTLSDYFAGTYLKWHREDPVDEQERTRCAVIEKIQGNVNPFVVRPELIEYLWGDKKGEKYGTGGQEGNPNEESDEKIPLRGEYVMSDVFLDLYTPYAPYNVDWKIDGMPCSGRIKLSALGVGEHEITYENNNVKGKLIIKIEP